MMMNSHLVATALFALVAFFLCFGVVAANDPFYIEVSEEQIEELLARPIYSDEMRRTIRQRISEGWHRRVGQEETVMEEKVEEDEGRRIGKRGHYGAQDFWRPSRGQSNVLSEQLVNATIVDSVMETNRTMELQEEMVTTALGAWLSMWRLSDTAEIYFNKVIGLNAMAYNLSLSAAMLYDGFESIPWVELFTDEVLCNLNFRQPDQDDDDQGWAFAFPNYCVEGVTSTYFANNTLGELQQTMLTSNEEMLLNADFNQISLSCATIDPEGILAADHGISSTYKWYCWMYFVQLSEDVNSSNCLCASYSCCPTSLGI